MADEPEANEQQYLDDVPQELQDLIFAGQKIQAIKLAREKKGWGLKEAKEQVESIQAQLRERFPDRFTASASGGGCAGVLLAAVALAGIVALLLARS